MAIQTYRYQQTAGNGSDIEQLRSEVDSTANINDTALDNVIDVQVDDALLTDMDEAMAARGYTRIAGPGVTGDINAVAPFVIRSGDTMTGTLDMNGNRITNLPDVPTANTDAVNANYVEDIVNQRDPKEAVRAATTQDLTAAGWTTSGSGVGKTLTSPSTATSNNDFDGVTLTVGDRLLVKEDGVDSGIYELTTAADGGGTSAVLTRADDFDENDEVTQGAFVFVAEGTENAGTAWQLVTQDPITVDTTSQTWTQVAATDSVTAGQGLIRTGNDIDVELDTDADAQGTGADGGSSGLEFDVTGDDGQLRVAVADYGGIQRGPSGLEVELDSAGAITSGVNGLAVGVDGTTIIVENNQLVASGLASTQLLWGANSITQTQTARFLYPGYSDGTAQSATIQWTAVRDGTLKNLHIRHNDTNGSNSTNVTYTIRVNGVDSSLAVTMAANATDGSDTTTEVTVTEGDLIDLRVTKAGSIGKSPRDITATVEFAG